jgi:hypothetical protein
MKGYSASGISSGSVNLVATSFAMPPGRGKPLSKTTSPARHVRPVDRIGDVVLALDALPGNVLERRHHRSHLGEDLAHMLVVPVAAHALGDVLDEPEVLPRLARQRQGLAAHLHLPVRVGDRAVLLRPGRGRQDHVGIGRGLGEEDVLHHEMLEVRERPRAWLRSGSDIAGFSPMMYMPLISSAWTASMISTTVLPRLGSSFTPQAASYFARISGVLHRLVVGEEHRDEAGVGGALHVVLAAQRMQARAGAADLAADQRERDQAARIVGAVGVLRDAHAPEDDGAFGAREGARDLAQVVGLDAADRRHLLGREGLHARFGELVEVLGVGLHILAVVELLRR